MIGPQVRERPPEQPLAVHSELAKHGRFALASVSLRFTVASGDLPDPRGHGASLGICREAVGAVVRELNRISGPVLARMGEC